MYDVAIFAGIGALLFLLLITAAFIKLRGRGKDKKSITTGNAARVLGTLPTGIDIDQGESKLTGQESDGNIQCFDVDKKDSLDEHLDVLTKKLAEKEGRLRLSKSKIRETQNEMDNLHGIDQDVRFKYREVMDSLKIDLLSNEQECKKLQEQIEWVSMKRAELKDEVIRGQRLYGVAAAELADNLAELQRGRTDSSAIEKPLQLHSSSTLKHRKESSGMSRPVNVPLIKSPTPQGSPPLFRRFYVNN